MGTDSEALRILREPLQCRKGVYLSVLIVIVITDFMQFPCRNLI